LKTGTAHSSIHHPDNDSDNVETNRVTEIHSGGTRSSDTLSSTLTFHSNEWQENKTHRT